VHSATIASSPRLQRVLAFLKKVGQLGATTRDIVTGADVCAVNSCIAELRANGIPIDCDMEGKGRFRYRLIPTAPAQGDLFGRSA